MIEQWALHYYSHKQRLKDFPSRSGGHTLTVEYTGCSSTKNNLYILVQNWNFVFWVKDLKFGGGMGEAGKWLIHPHFCLKKQNKSIIYKASSYFVENPYLSISSCPWNSMPVVMKKHSLFLQWKNSVIVKKLMNKNNRASLM